MTTSVLAQIFARDPRKLARFPDVPVDEALAEWQRLQRGLKEKNETPPPAAETKPAAAATAAELEALGGSLSALATNVWRAKTRMIDPATGEPREEMKRVYRHVEGALEAFAQMGLTLNDWVNQPYDAGLPVKVLTFQPTAGLVRDTVLEVVRPTVIWQDRLLQLGEVVVGIPPTAESAKQP